MAVRVIKKSLAGSEDLLLGFGTELQVRNDKNIEITRINASNIPYNEDTSISEFMDTINKKVDTIAALRSMTDTFDTINVLGYYDKGDGGGGLFYWDETSTEADNGGTIIQATGVTTGRWKKINNSISSTSEYATKTLHDSVVGSTHSSGSVYTLSKSITSYDAWTYGLIEFDINTTTSGMIKLLINGSDIFGDQPNGYFFSSDTILLDGTENNRILDNHTYTFAVGSMSTPITSISLETDTSWAGTVYSIKLYKLNINSMDLSIVANGDIGQNYATGIKGGIRARGDMAFGDTSALMAFQYDGNSPTPAYNLAVGYGALASNQRGDENTAVGSMSLMNNEGSDNVALGYSSLKLNTKGQENTAVGYKAGVSNTTGYRNTYMGFWAGFRNATGIENTMIGWQPNTAGSGTQKYYNTYVGSRTGSGYAGSNNVAIGASSARSISGQEEINASFITAVGVESKPLGNSSVVVGFQATVGTEAVLAANAIAIGRNANSLLTGNIAFGHLANASGSNQSIAIGQNTTSSGDTSISIGKSTQSTGARSLAVGDTAKASGQQSVSIGALTVAGIGDYNTNIGGRAGLNLNGSYNTFLGWFAGNQTATYNNVTCLGQGTAVSGSNQVQLGNSATTTYVYGTVQNRSDIRDKAEVQDSDLGLDFISKLRPVKYKWDLRDSYYEYREDDEGNIVKIEVPKDGSKKGNRYHYGLIAQELKEVSESIGIDFGGLQDHEINGGSDVMSIGYDELIAPLIKAVQELSLKVKELELK